MADDAPNNQVPAGEPGGPPLGGGLTAGQKVFGRYVLEAEAGRGGMGVVWRAQDEELGEMVALKFLPDVLARDEAAVDDLKAETRQARRLTHPYIVRVHQFERDETMAAVSMEFIDGVTLSALRLQQPGKVFSVEKLAPIVAQLCAALDYAHNAVKVAHLDLKPANVLVTKEGQAKVTDFGIARSMTESQQRLTGKTKDAGGTLPYMSPQQVMGRTPTAADDIYAIGAMLYELLTGKPPFYRGGSYSLMKQIAEVKPRTLTEQRAELGVAGEEIPRVWQDAILACLAKEPEQRPASMQEFCVRLFGSAPLGTMAPLGTGSAGGGESPGLRTSTTPAVPKIRMRTQAEEFGSPIAREGFVVFVFPPEAAATVSLGGTSNAPVKKGKVTVPDLLDREYELRVEAPGYVTHTSRVTPKTSKGLATVMLLPDPSWKAGAAAVTRGSSDNLAQGPEGKPKPGPLPGDARVASPTAGAEMKAGGRGAGAMTGTASGLPGGTAPAMQMAPAGQGRRGADAGAPPPRSAIPPPPPVEVRSAAPFPTAGETLTPGAKASVKKPARKPLITGLLVAVVLLVAWIGYSLVGSWTTRKAEKEQKAARVASQERQRAAQAAEEAEKAGTVMCETTPPGARVVINGGDQRNTTFVDGQTKTGKLTPLRGALPAGTYTLRFELKGYKTVERTVAVEAGATANVAVAMEEYHGPDEGQRWTIPDLGLAMEPIAAGGFIMGLESGSIDEKPQTRVTLSRPFWLGKTEVTQGQYEALMGSNPAFFKNAGRDAPVEQVSWADAMEFCRKLTEREQTALRLPDGYQYTLPTEAQWEYACRAGTKGDNAGRLETIAWYDRNSGHTTHPVGQKQANPWRLYDMHGNVWEWCLDWRMNYPGGSVRDWAGPPSGSYRVNRGGGWNHGAQYCRSGNRYGAEPGIRRSDVGFRVALAPVR